VKGSHRARAGWARRAADAFRHRSSGANTVAIATASTIVVLAVVAVSVVNSPGWPRVQSVFFSAEVFSERFGEILWAFRKNVELFLTAEVLILVGGLLLAVMRSLAGPVFFPLRAAAVIYIDVMRGLPSILVIYILGFGIPALGLEGVPRDPFIWALVALSMVWSAYVAEVYRAGIESVHPSQDAAARSLGLSAAQSMRHVVLPQAVRRVVPPLLNDFIGLMKDTALISFIGPIEAFRRAQIANTATFNFTPFLVTAVIFLLLTIPLSRFVDWLVSRDRRRQLAGAR
jgi:polar amino acid transport system permease protein